MVAYSDSTANNGSQIVKYVVSSIPAASTATHIGAGSPTMKMSGLLPDTDYSFRVCATNAAGTTCSTTSPKIHTYPLAPAFTLNPTSETGVYGTAITGYTITQTGGNSTVYPTSYSISPVIPNGFSFSTTTGLLSGTPTGTQSPIVYIVTGTNISGTGSATFTLDVIKANQTISFAAISDTKTYGDAAFELSATATSNLPVSFASATLGTCLVSGSTVTIAGAGTCSVTASQAGNENYNAATDVVRSFTIDKATLIITPDSDQGKVYDGTSAATLTYTTSGLVSGDAITGDLDQSGFNVGSYAIGIGTIDAGVNYTVVLVPVDFTVTAKAITITADDAFKTFGQADPAVFTYTVPSGALLGSDALTGTLSRAPGESVGTYPISGVLSNPNYTVTVTPSTFTIIAVKQARVSLSWNCLISETTLQAFNGNEFKFCDVIASAPGTIHYTSGDLSIFDVSGAGRSEVGHPNGIGSATLTATFTPTDTTAYASGETITLTVHIVSGSDVGPQSKWTGYQAP
jgi:hypothetical protein